VRPALDKEKLQAVYDRVARRYDRQHALLTAHSDQHGRTLLVKKAVSRGDRVLDCGAGTGSTGLLAAQQVGPTGRVTLFDASAGMLAVAGEKAAKAGLRERIEIKVGDMLHLPYADESFDSVLSTYSMCPVGDPIRAAREVFRVTKPGGRIGVAHSSDPDNPLARGVARLVEDMVWHFPSISLGCRAVNVLPTFRQLGGRIVFKRKIGVPLWPFLVFVVEKPGN